MSGAIRKRLLFRFVHCWKKQLSSFMSRQLSNIFQLLRLKKMNISKNDLRMQFDELRRNPLENPRHPGFDLFFFSLKWALEPKIVSMLKSNDTFAFTLPVCFRKNLLRHVKRHLNSGLSYSADLSLNTATADSGEPALRSSQLIIENREPETKRGLASRERLGRTCEKLPSTTTDLVSTEKNVGSSESTHCRLSLWPPS